MPYCIPINLNQCRDFLTDENHKKPRPFHAFVIYCTVCSQSVKSISEGTPRGIEKDAIYAIYKSRPDTYSTFDLPDNFNAQENHEPLLKLISKNEI